MAIEFGTSGWSYDAYFNNDGYGHAVFNAETLRAILGE
jgi:hypothetical protein